MNYIKRMVIETIGLDSFNALTLAEQRRLLIRAGDWRPPAPRAPSPPMPEGFHSCSTCKTDCGIAWIADDSGNKYCIECGWEHAHGRGRQLELFP